MPTKILSLDPSLNNWGYAILDYEPNLNTLTLQHCGVINPPKGNKYLPKQNQKDIATATNIYQELYYLINKVDIWVAEIPIGSQSSRAMVSYALCCGVIGSLTCHNPKLIQISPYEVKKYIGDKTTDKQQIINWVRQQHPQTQHLIPQAKNKAEHICDAIMACHVALKQIKEQYP